MLSGSPWWRRDIHADRRPRLLARQAMAMRLRAHFCAQDFIEVDTSALQISPGNETHLHAFATHWDGIAGATQPLYLHTSPEFACKKILAAGERRIFSFAHVMRNRELGPLHQPEFTMLEWYRVEADIAALMADCTAILRECAACTGVRLVNYRQRICDPRAEPVHLTVGDAFLRHAGINLLSTIAMDGTTDRDKLAAATTSLGLRVAADDTWSDLFSRILADRIEPKLGIGQPTFLTEYPLPEAALARPLPRDSRLAERFELYMCGVELANAFGELTDPGEQRRRFIADMAEKQRIYGHTYPLDEDFLAALAHMPAASGAALGFDRLVMLMTGANRLDEVMWTPFSDPGRDGR